MRSSSGSRPAERATPAQTPPSTAPDRLRRTPDRGGTGAVMPPTLPPRRRRGHPRAPTGRSRRGNTRRWPRLAPGMDVLTELPRVVAWLREEHPAATDARIGAMLDRLAPEHLQRLERLLDDLARTCRPPAPADLAALRELDDLLDGAAD